MHDMTHDALAAASAGLLTDEPYDGDLLEPRLFDADELAWMASGLCAQTDPEVFFPEKGGSAKEAKRTCMACEVRTQCLDWAIDNGERHGIWGGLTERERRTVRRARLTGTTGTGAAA